MAEKSFTKEEWDDLLRAPLMAGLAVAAASPSGLIGALQEASALSKLLVETKKGAGANPLIDGAIDDLMTPEGRERAKPKGLLGKSADQVRKEALGAIQRAAELAEQKGPAGAAPAYKAWLSAVAHRVAEASKEGGFLGFGGVEVSEAETATLRDLDSILGTKAHV
jgi:hypothetical protein